MNGKKPHFEEESSDKNEAENSKIIVLAQRPPSDNATSRKVRLFGEVTEEKSEELIGEMLSMADEAEEMVPKNPEDPECKETERVVHGIDFLISTYGGNADDMFGIYDMMKHVQQQCPISTYGIGKVMSAGVLLLAAGTKGERRIGKNCRVMLHHVAGGLEGSLPSMETDLESLKVMEKRYLEIMVEETKFTKRSLQKLLDKKVNVYLNAEEAIKQGIADKYI